MPQIDESALINAPVSQVFAYLEDPHNRPEFWPSLIEVSEVEALPEGGSTFKWVYKMAGVRSDGTTETIEYAANERMVDVNKGGIPSTITWGVAPEDGKTRLTFHITYDVNLPVLKKLAQSFLVRMNEQEAKTLVANIKAKMEAR